MSGVVSRSLQAFLDESQSDRVRDPHCYVLAAGVAVAGAVDEVRATMEGLRLPGQLKVHWHDESASRRRQVMSVVAGLPLQHVVVVRPGRSGERGERQRRHCLERMLYELDQLEVVTATFESRGRADDGRDRSMLDALRARKVVTSGLRIEHTAGPNAPLLWVPDVMCGAVTHERTGEPRYLQTMGERVRVISITADSARLR